MVGNRLPPRSPTRDDYIAMGVDPGVLDRLEREAEASREKAAAAPPVPATVSSPDVTRMADYRVLRMSEQAEEAACRFMDEGYRAGIRDHAQPPSFLWITAWGLIGTSHHRLILAFRPRAILKVLEPPCSLAEILLYSAKPAIDRDESECRADGFCRSALGLARSRYRDGFYADPFTTEPARRPQSGKAH